MSLRVRIVLLLTGTVFGTVVLLWALGGRTIMAPLIEDALKAHIRRANYLVERMKDGENPRELARKLGFDARLVRKPPRFVRRTFNRRGPCQMREIESHPVVACPGPGHPLAIKTRTGGWLVMRRHVDLEATRKKFLYLMIVVAIAVLVMALFLANRITKPLETTVSAMERIAGGDLGHRLQISGSKELAEASRVFNSMADRVEGLLQAERAFMASISHELRTPLARLRLELEMLRDGTPSEKRISAMEADVGEVDELVGELLESSRLSLGANQLNLSNSSLREVAEEALSLEDLSRHTIELKGEDPPLSIDHARMVRVVRNLVANAVKYSPRDTCISISIEKGRLSISDEGPGVQNSELAKLFQPFFRGKNAQQGRLKGYGLGLMIAQQIVELHSGQIKAENIQPTGLKVSIEFPQAT